MAAPLPDDSLLLIRCPSCGQRFKVGEDLRERTVECGGCEHRFRIDDEVIVRGRKFYPGERRDPSLNRYQRVPLSRSDAPVAGLQPVHYAEAPEQVVLEPATPQRVIAGAVGAAGMVVMALLLMFGASRGGLLDGMITRDRLLMAGFAALLGTALLVYANPRARLKGLGVGLLLGCGLVAVPFFFQQGSRRLDEGGVLPPPAVAAGEETEPAEAAVDPELKKLRERIGTEPLEDEIARLERDGSDRRALGLWLRGMNATNRYLVRDYILRATDADPTSHVYPRPEGDYLMVVTGVRMSLQQLADLSKVLGEVAAIHPEVAVVEVAVRNENFMEGPIEKLTNSDDPAFYDLNKRELESIDLVRVKRAVQRLAEAEPKIYRDDITRELISLLEAEEVDFKDIVSRALQVWAPEPGPAGEAALRQVELLAKDEAKIPQEMVALVVHEGNEGIIPILDELWARNPAEWESLYGELGPAAEPTLIRRFPSTSGIIRYSAVRVLGHVGQTDSLKVLEDAKEGADNELTVLISQAEKLIRDRMAE